MFNLHEPLKKATFESKKDPIQCQIAAKDENTDQLVYELYGLTKNEIEVVERKQG